MPPVFIDPLAGRIVEPRHLDNHARERGRIAAHLRAFLAVRSRIAEDELAHAVARGVAQYVILGAGLDTFAYRTATPGNPLRVFEVDHPATQAWKKRRLAAAGIAVPSSLTFVPLDFERDSLERGLRDAGVRADRPAFFAWLGVTPYLKRDAIATTLRLIARTAVAGGGVVFDYGVSPSTLGWRRAVYAVLAARVRAAGEPWVTTLKPGELNGTLRELGFSRIVDWGPEELNARYFAGRRDGLRVGGTGRVVTALTC